MIDSNLAILHDHYKESFALIRDREKQRDRLFLYLVGLVGVLFLGVQYPDLVPTALDVSAPVAKVNLGSVPMAVIASATWTVVLLFSLRYCQYTVLIDRQYYYLHTLEDKISVLLGDDELYRREGKVYDRKYPAVSWWAWFMYTLVFPGAVIFAVTMLVRLEWRSITIPTAHKWYDTIFAGGVALTFVLYKFIPLGHNSWQRIRPRRKSEFRRH